jgi:DNA-binding MarR family transcriptional regulator
VAPIDPTTQLNLAWDVIGTDPVALAEVLLPVLPRLKHMGGWPGGHQPPQGPQTISQYRAVACLFDHDAVCMRDLATALQLSAPATSELVDRLVERGSVTRRRDPGDRRQVVVELTAPTRAAWRHKREERLRRLAGVIEKLAPGERQGFVRGMIFLAEEIVAGGTAAHPDHGTASTLP